MLLRQALLAAVLLSGIAGVAAAQSDEFPFRSFAPRHRIVLRQDMHPYRFSMRDSERMRATTERLRNRAFTMRDRASERQMDMHFRSMDRMHDRLRERMDQFRFERPMKLRRHSRDI